MNEPQFWVAADLVEDLGRAVALVAQRGQRRERAARAARRGAQGECELIGRPRPMMSWSPHGDLLDSDPDPSPSPNY